MPKYWINVVSHDHVQRGVAGGFTQANHGKPHMLKRMERDDWIIFYSPKTAFDGGEPVQSFTAIGKVTDDEPYQFDMNNDFHPWRRSVLFKKCQDAAIRPMIEELEFIEDVTHWGYKFRFGVFEINEHDFRAISRAMKI